MLEEVWRNPWVRAGLLLAALALLAVVAYFLSPVLVPLFLAFLVAYLLDPVVDHFEARGIRRSLTVGGLAVIGLLLLLSLPLILALVLREAEDIIQAASARAQAERAAAAGVEDIEQPEGWFEGLQSLGQSALEALPLETVVDTLGLREEGMEAYSPAQVIAVQLADYVRTHARELLRGLGGMGSEAGQAAGAAVAGWMARVWGMVVGFFEFIMNIAVFGFVAGYLLTDYDTLVKEMFALIPKRWRPAVERVTGRIDFQLRGFLRGQVLVCLCLAAFYAVGFLISGTPMALLIAAFGFVMGFIPFLGPTLTIAPALLLTWVVHGLDWHIAGVVVTFALAQFIEGNILTPNIVGNKVGLHPVWVILALLVFGKFFGFVGLLAAVPLAAVIKVFVVEAVEAYRRSAVFRSEAGG